MTATRIAFTTLLIASATCTTASPLESATLTASENEVRISKDSAEAHDAKQGESFDSSSTLLTGRKSRAELTFPDQTITRIGSNSVFRFKAGSREMEMERGSFLLNVPKSAGGATIRTATVTAAITGTTTMMEFSPDEWVKFIVIEGTANLSNKAGDRIRVAPGQMIVMHPNALRFPKPVILNMQKLVRTSRLMERRMFGDLKRNAVGNIDRSMATQMGRRRRGDLLPTGAVIRGPGMRVGEGGDGSESASGGPGRPRPRSGQRMESSSANHMNGGSMCPAGQVPIPGVPGCFSPGGGGGSQMPGRP